MVSVFQASRPPAASQLQQLIEQKHGAHDNGEKGGKSQISHSGNQTADRGQKKAADFSGGSGNGTKANQAESACHGYAGSHISVDQHNHNADNGGQQAKVTTKLLLDLVRYI